VSSGEKGGQCWRTGAQTETPRLRPASMALGEATNPERYAARWPIAAGPDRPVQTAFVRIFKPPCKHGGNAHWPADGSLVQPTQVSVPSQGPSWECRMDADVAFQLANRQFR